MIDYCYNAKGVFIFKRPIARKEHSMSKYNEKSKEYTMQYMKDNLEEIRFRVKKGEKDKYKEAAEKSGLSMAKFFTVAANEKIERDDLSPVASETP